MYYLNYKWYVYIIILFIVNVLIVIIININIKKDDPNGNLLQIKNI